MMVRGLTVKDAPGRRSTRIEKVFKKKSGTELYWTQVRITPFHVYAESLYNILFCFGHVTEIVLSPNQLRVSLFKTK